MIHFLGLAKDKEIIFSLYRPAIVLAVLVSAVFLGMIATPSMLTPLVLLVCSILFFVGLMRWPVIGPLVLILVSFLVRFNVGTGTNVPLNASILITAGLLAAWIFCMLAVENNIGLSPSRVNRLALAFVVATTLSLIVGNIRWILWIDEKASIPAQLGGWGLYVFPIGILLMVGTQLKNLKQLQVIVWLFLAIGGSFILCRLAPPKFLLERIFVRESIGAMFWVWLTAMALGQVLFNRELALRWRFFLVFLVAATFYASWFRGHKEWVSGWLPAFVGVVTLLWLRSWRWGLVLTSLCALILISAFALLRAEVMTPIQEASLAGRMYTWSIMFELIKVNPIFGLGLSNYSFFTYLYNDGGWIFRFNSHNQYLDLLAQTGALGFGLFLWMIVEIGRIGIKLLRRAHQGFIRGYAGATLGGLAGMLASGLLGDWFLPYLYNIGMAGFRSSLFAWLFLGGLLALDHITENDARQY